MYAVLNQLLMCFQISVVLIKNFWHCTDGTLKLIHCVIHLQMFFFYACHYKLQGVLFFFFLCGEVVLPFPFPFWEGKRGGGRTRSTIWREWIWALRIEGEVTYLFKGLENKSEFRDGGVLNKRKIEAGIAQCGNGSSALNLSCLQIWRKFWGGHYMKF